MLNNIRNQFPLLVRHKDLAFLDNAASTQKPEVVLKAMEAFYRETYANIHRAVYRLAEAATAAYEEAREIAAKFVNAREAAEVIFTRNATQALNLVAQSYARGLQPGDEVLLTELEHHANLVPWQQTAKRHRLVLKFLPVTPEGRLEIGKLSELLTPKTKVVAVSAMSNVLGCITELDQIIPAAHKVGAMVVVDAAQAAAHMPLDVQRLDCDFLSLTGHKLFGPSGIGLLYGKRSRLEHLEPFEYGGSMIAEVAWHDSTWAELPAKFEAGTPPIVEAVGLGVALRFIAEMGWEKFMALEAELTNYGLEQLTKVPGLHLVGPLTPERRGPVFSFTVDGVHPHDLASVLDEAQVAVRSGHHCAQPLHRKLGLPATTRASFTIYNSREEVDRLVEGIKKAQELFRK